MHQQPISIFKGQISILLPESILNHDINFRDKKEQVKLHIDIESIN